MKLPNEIDEYLASRNFSENTRSNYHYDLVSLQAFFEDKSLTIENLELYKIQISNLSTAAQRRKISSANQYLLFLYQRQKVDQYFKIKQVVQKKSQTDQSYHPMIKEFPEFYGPLTCPGQFLALLILEFGLNFAEIQKLKWENFNWNFKYLTIEKAGIKRVLPIREKFAIRVKAINNADELFAKSRQFLYTELKKFTNYSSKEIREQYILHQVKTGKSIYELATLLGLTTITTLEKYYR
ncbi:site-specific tyrosine recombinase XerD [Lactococcus lactis]|uniref:site-specific tyrosine recombinase XerD n=1 Tax=Lactococcus lactis TaxID=1358 RepID=UPI003D111E0E